MNSHLSTFKVNGARLLIAVLTLFILTAVPVRADTGASGDNTQMKPCRTGPYVKNLMAPGTASCSSLTGNHKLSARQLRKLAASTHTADDHRRAATYYRERTDDLEASGLAYRKAAADLERAPLAKNLCVPGTAERYKMLGQRFLDEASLERKKGDLEDSAANPGISGGQSTGGGN